MRLFLCVILAGMGWNLFQHIFAAPLFEMLFGLIN